MDRVYEENSHPVVHFQDDAETVTISAELTSDQIELDVGIQPSRINGIVLLSAEIQTCNAMLRGSGPTFELQRLSPKDVSSQRLPKGEAAISHVTVQVMADGSRHRPRVSNSTLFW